MGSRAAPALLWSSPLPPTRSGVADYAAEIVPELARLVPLRVVAPPDWQGDRERWPAAIDAEAAPPAGFIELANLGNNPYHLWIAARLRRFGGVAIVHDTVLHHLLVEEAAAADDWEGFARELGDAHGAAGVAIAGARRWGYAGRLDPFLLPARAVLLRHASAVVVHGSTAERAVRAACPGLPVVRVPLAVAALPAPAHEQARAETGVPADELLLLHLGFLTPAKGLDVILLALAAATRLGASVRLVMVGEGGERDAIERAIAALGLGGRVQLPGYVDAPELGRLVAAADLGLVPRYPTAGETSAAALRFLAAGTPIAVGGYGQFLELPEAAAIRVPPGRAGVAELVRWLTALSSDRASLVARRAVARRVWEAGGHAPDRAAAALVEAVSEVGRELAARG